MGHAGLAFIRLKLASRLPEDDVLLLRKLLFYHELTRDVNKLITLMYFKKDMSPISKEFQCHMAVPHFRNKYVSRLYLIF